jgi:outer membrane protein OmpA-like peptidoglycan-associated protein
MKKNRYRHIKLVIALFLMSISVVVSVYAQGASYITDHPEGTNYRERLIDYADIYTYEILQGTKDTLLYVRTINDFWYGVWGGPNFNFSFGDLKSLVDPNNDKDVFNTIIDFGSKFGTGYSIGIMGEMTSKTSDFSFGLKLAAIDKKISNVPSSDIAGYYAQYYNYEAKYSSSISYFVISPYTKYSFPFLDGLFVSGGLDAYIMYKTVAELEPEFENTGEIYHKMPLTDVKANTRFGISLGVGYDFFIADFFATNNRVRITPYAEFKAGTNIITANSSNWNDLGLNIGLQFKISHDKIKVDTLRFDPRSEFAPEYFASLKSDDGIEFVGFTHKLDIPPAFDVAYVEVPREPEVVTDTVPTTPVEPEKPIVAVTEPGKDTADVAVNIPSKTEPPAPKASPAMNLRLGQTDTLNGYTSATSTALDSTMRTTLDQYAQYMKEHPNVIIRLQGHSDNQGTLAQNQTRSQQRMNAVKNYLMSKGIPERRIFGGYVGSTKPAAVNTTEAGRRKNRRVEMVLENSSGR